jgi:hypothetical protein
VGLQEVLGTAAAFLFGEDPVGVSFVKEPGEERSPGRGGVFPAIDFRMEAVGTDLTAQTALGGVHLGSPSGPCGAPPPSRQLDRGNGAVTTVRRDRTSSWSAVVPTGPTWLRAPLLPGQLL